MVVALAHVLMPFMVLSVWAALQRLDPQIENAAVALGAGPLTVLRRIVLPQVMPGMLSGAIIVFALAASAFATPAIIGGRRLKVASTLAYDEFLNTLNWPLGAAVAVLLLVALVADRRRRQPRWSSAATRRCSDEPATARSRSSSTRCSSLFMLAPIVVVCLVAFTPEGFLSFPTDRWSLRWFRAIARYPEFVSAFWRSLWLGALSSAIARRRLGAGGARHRALSLPRPRGADGAVHVAADDPARRARHRLPALLHPDRAGRHLRRPGARAHRDRVAVRAAPDARLGDRHGPRHRACRGLARRLGLDGVQARDPAADPAGRWPAAGRSPSSNASTR